MTRLVGYLVRADLRRRWLSALVLALLLGGTAGIAMSAWAGARRTESAFPRYIAGTGAEDVTVTSGGDPVELDIDAIAQAPGARRAGRIWGYGALPLAEPGIPDISSGFLLIAPGDRELFDAFARPLLLDGRTWHPEAADEVVVNEATEQQGYGIGSEVPVCVFNFAELESTPEPDTPEALHAAAQKLCDFRAMRVVGVGRLSSDLVVREQNSDEPTIVASPAFVESASKAPSWQASLVDLEPGADVEQFTAAVRAAHPGDPLEFQSGSLRAATYDRAVTPYVQALRLFAVAVAIATLAILAPVIARWAAPGLADLPALRSLGVPRLGLRAMAATRAVLVGAGASLVAASATVVSSPLFPIGPARQAEIDRGIDADLVVLLSGIGLLLLVSIAAGLLAGQWARATRSDRPSWLAEHAASSGLGAPATLGLRAALSRRGDQAAGPVATAAGVGLAIIAVVGTLVFGASLERLLNSPERIGWNWTAAYESFDAELRPEVLEAIAANPTVTDRALGHRAVLEIDGHAAPAWALEQLEGSIEPTILAGRAPAAEDELALGGQTLDRVGKEIGDTVTVVGRNGEQLDATITGQALLPLFNLGEELTVGEATLATPEGLERLGGAESGVMLVKSTESVDALRRALVGAGLLDEFSNEIQGPDLTGDLVSYDRVRDTPLLLAAVLALLGVGVLAHTLVTSIRQRRRELAVLRCLGFRRRQIAATIHWHALTLVLACALVCVPLGLAAGRTIWSEFAGNLGVIDDAASPLLAVATVVVGALVLAALLAIVPGRVAARVRPATVLRAE